MQRNPADDTAQVFAEGFFEVLGALIQAPVSFELESCAPVTTEEAVQALEQWPVVMQGRLAQGSAVGLLFTSKDALRMAGMVFGNGQKLHDTPAEHDLATLTELGEHAIKHALEQVAGHAALTLTLDAVHVTHEGPVSDTRLGPVLATDASMAAVHFSAAPDLDAEAVLVFPNGWSAAAASPETPAAAEAAPVEAEVEEEVPADDPAEWDAILSELNPKKELGMAPDTGREPGRDAGALGGGPSNLDMVLDIRLVVRARLGRIEMPIGDILALGPGSIVDVGRMLDEPVEVLVNDKLIARGDVVVVDEKFGLRITEIVSPRERIESLR